MTPEVFKYVVTVREPSGKIQYVQEFPVEMRDALLKAKNNYLHMKELRPECRVTIAEVKRDNASLYRIMSQEELEKVS